MADRGGTRSKRRATLTIGVGWALRGSLESEAGVDLILASSAEPPLFFHESLDQLRESFDEAGLPVTMAESDPVLAGLLRAALIAGRRAVAFFSERGLRQGFDALFEAARIEIPEGGGGVLVAVQTAWAPGRAASVYSSSGLRSAPGRRGTAGVGVSVGDRDAGATSAAAPLFDVREIALSLQWPVLMPSTPDELRRMVNDAMRLSRAVRRIVMLVAPPGLAGAAETDVAIDESAGRLRASAPDTAATSTTELDADPVVVEVRRRRLDQLLNQAARGEEAPLGFIAAGAPLTALRQALYMLGITGRVPILKIACVAPIDSRAIGRMLDRCAEVIIVEAGMPVLERAVRDEARSAGHTTRITSLREIAGAPVSGSLDLHPSAIVEALGERLRSFRPQHGPDVAARLAESRQLSEATRRLSFQRTSRARSARDVTVTLMGLILRELHEELAHPAADRPVIELFVESLDGASLEPREGARSVIEIERRRLASVGRAAIAHAMRRQLPITFLIVPDPLDSASTLSTSEADRLVRSLVIDMESSRAEIATIDPTDGAHCRFELRRAILSRAVTILIIDIDPYLKPGEHGPRGEISLMADELFTRPSSGLTTLNYEWLIRRGWNDSSRLDGRHGPKLALPDPDDPLVSPLDGWDGFEELQVRRRSGSAAGYEAMAAATLPDPVPRHGHSPVWRAHITGPPGPAFSDTVTLLEQAGRRMGYRVQSVQGRVRGVAFRQIAFSHPRADEPPLPISPRIPYGDADLVIALDLESLFQSLEEDGGHRVASPARSWLVLDLSPSLDMMLEPAWLSKRPTVPGDLNSVLPPARRAALRAAETADRLFSNRRLVGVILLGVAFQMGLVPVTEEKVTRAASRSLDQPADQAALAFEIGRRIVATGDDPTRATEERLPKPEAIIRRHRRVMAARRLPRAERLANEFHALALGALDAVTGLRRTDPSRIAELRFVSRLVDCERWGGLPMCRDYSMRIRAIYAAERSVTDYPITRLVIQELARAMLIADAFFVAATVQRPDRIRSDERRLRLNRAGGDRIASRMWSRTPERMRFLAGRSWRIGPRLGALLYQFRFLRHWPWSHRRQKAHRAWVESLVDRCSGELPMRASLWLEVFRQLTRVRGCGVRRRIMMSRAQSAISALLELGGALEPAEMQIEPETPRAPEARVQV